MKPVFWDIVYTIIRNLRYRVRGLMKVHRKTENRLSEEWCHMDYRSWPITPCQLWTTPLPKGKQESCFKVARNHSKYNLCSCMVYRPVYDLNSELIAKARMLLSGATETALFLQYLPTWHAPVVCVMYTLAGGRWLARWALSKWCTMGAGGRYGTDYNTD